MSEKRDDPVDLALVEDFRLGALAISPSTREARRGELRETLEPRVMQVLVALSQAEGRVVSRDELIARCWEGRVVGEDAINRAIGRLRRLSEADDGASFRIETIAKVGYRLTAGQAAAPGTTGASLPARRNRRWLLVSGAAGTVAALAAGGMLLRRTASVPAPAPSSKLALQLEMAKQAWRGGNPEAGAQAAGLYEAATRIAPDSATAWGGMALAYAYAGRAAPDQVDAFHFKAEDAMRHARSIDPHEPLSYAAQGNLLPIRGAWTQREAAFREGLKFNPKSDELWLTYCDMLNNAGRNRDAADMAVKANMYAVQPDSSLIWLSTTAYWCAGRLAEADAIAAQGAILFPRHRSCWFTRAYLLMFTGRSDQALAMLNDANGRPVGQPDTDFDSIAAVARALKSKARADIDAAMATTLALAHEGSGYAENAITFAAALGRLDDAFAVADALYFDRGFKVGTFRFSALQRAFTFLQDRRTRTLFYPSSSAMWRDRRFAALVDELGLAKYWKDAGVVPDYQRA